MRVLVTTDCVGGVWRYAVTLGRELGRRGHAVALATIGPAPSSAQREEAGELELIQSGAPLDWEKDGAERVDAGRRRLTALARRHGADVVLLNQPAYGGGDWPLPVVAVAHSCVRTWWLGTHDTLPPEEWSWHGRAVEAGLRASKAVVVPSASFRSMLAEAYPQAPDACVVHNGAPLPPAPSAQSGASVLAAGRLWDEAKDMGTLDRAAAALAWPVEVAGPDTAPGGKRVRFSCLQPLGTLSRVQMEKRLSNAGIFVAPSLYEPFGLAVLEAARRRRPLVLSDIATFRELWNGAALFYPPKDHEALSSALCRVCADGALRERLGAAAEARARLYSEDRQAGAMESLLARAAGRSLTAGAA